MRPVAMRRRLRAMGLAAALLSLTLLCSAGVARWLWQRHDLVRKVDDDLAEAIRALRTGNLRDAQTALQRADDRGARDGPADLAARAQQVHANLAVMERLDHIRLDAAVMTDGEIDYHGLDRDYAAFFREEGLGQPAEDAEVVATRVRDAIIRDQLVAALDDWASATEDRERRAW